MAPVADDTPAARMWQNCRTREDPSGKRICIFLWTSDGCDKKGDCTFSHAVNNRDGTPICTSAEVSLLSQHAKVLRARAAERARSKTPGPGKGGGGKGKGKGDKGKSSGKGKSAERKGGGKTKAARVHVLEHLQGTDPRESLPKAMPRECVSKKISGALRAQTAIVPTNTGAQILRQARGRWPHQRRRPTSQRPRATRDSDARGLHAEIPW